MRFLARFLAVVLAAAFVVATVVVLFVRPLGTRLLAPQAYKEVLREKQVAERLPALAADMLAKGIANGGGTAKPGSGDFSGFLSGFDQNDLETLLGAVLPADYVRGQLDGVIDQFFGYVNSEAARPSVKLSLVDLKRRLSGGVLEDAYVKVLQTKPPCATDTGVLPAACCPPAERLPEVRERFREMIAPAVKELPDSVDLFAVRDGGQADRVFAMVGQVRGRLRVYATLARWGWVVPVVLLLGVAVFGVRSLRGLLLWWGVPCLVAGGVALMCALPGAALGDLFFQWLIKPQLPAEVPAEAVEAVFGVAMGVVLVVLGAALKSATYLALGGGMAVVLALFLRSKPKAA
jgi:hypothetical protein